MVSLARHFVPNPVSSNRTDRRLKCQCPLFLHTRYDAWNRLVEVNDAGDDPIEEYRYDGFGRRIVKNTSYSGGAFQDTYDYVYNRKYQVMAEYLDGDEEHALARYVWHPYYIDAPAMRYYDADTDGIFNENDDGEHFYAHDANFNVTALLKDDGTALERYHYDPYGKPTRYNGSWGTPSTDYKNPYLYTGRRLDDQTGLYYYRARYYGWALARFMTRDPIGYRGGQNLYQYVQSSPLNLVDPAGLQGQVVTVACIRGDENSVDDRLLECPGYFKNFYSRSADDFFRGIEKAYWDCMRQRSGIGDERQRHKECCIRRLRRSGHASAGLGGECDFGGQYAPDSDRFKELAAMFCSDASIEDYGCYGFEYKDEKLGKAHRGYPLLLQYRGGWYKGYKGLTCGNCEEGQKCPPEDRFPGFDYDQEQIRVNPVPAGDEYPPGRFEDDFDRMNPGGIEPPTPDAPGGPPARPPGLPDLLRPLRSYLGE